MCFSSTFSFRNLILVLQIVKQLNLSPSSPDWNFDLHFSWPVLIGWPITQLSPFASYASPIMMLTRLLRCFFLKTKLVQAVSSRASCDLYVVRCVCSIHTSDAITMRERTACTLLPTLPVLTELFDEIAARMSSRLQFDFDLRRVRGRLWSLHRSNWSSHTPSMYEIWSRKGWIVHDWQIRLGNTLDV